MNKKTINRILIVVVVIIWSALLYRIFNKQQTKNHKFFYSNENLQAPVQLISKDTFELAKLKRDPFLGTIQIKKEPRLKTKTINTTKTSKKRSAIKWPVIQYLGYVKGERSTKPLIVLKINNKLLKERLYSTIDGVYLKRIYKDSLIVTYSNQEKVIYRH